MILAFVHAFITVLQCGASVEEMERRVQIQKEGMKAVDSRRKMNRARRSLIEEKCAYKMCLSANLRGIIYSPTALTDEVYQIMRDSGPRKSELRKACIKYLGFSHLFTGYVKDVCSRLMKEVTWVRNRCVAENYRKRLSRIIRRLAEERDGYYFFTGGREIPLTNKELMIMEELGATEGRALGEAYMAYIRPATFLNDHIIKTYNRLITCLSEAINVKKKRAKPFLHFHHKDVGGKRVHYCTVTPWPEIETMRVKKVYITKAYGRLKGEMLESAFRYEPENGTSFKIEIPSDITDKFGHSHLIFKFCYAEDSGHHESYVPKPNWYYTPEYGGLFITGACRHFYRYHNRETGQLVKDICNHFNDQSAA